MGEQHDTKRFVPEEVPGEDQAMPAPTGPKPTVPKDDIAPATEPLFRSGMGSSEPAPPPDRVGPTEPLYPASALPVTEPLFPGGGFERPAPAPTAAPTQKIYLAPDGSRITGMNGPVGGPRVHGAAYPGGERTVGFAPPPPPQASWNPQGAPSPGSAGPGRPAPGAPPGYGPSRAQAELADTPVNVGMLVWGVVLAIGGLLLILVSIAGPNVFPALAVILFAAAGIGFLVMAYVTAQKTGNRPVEVPPVTEGGPASS